VPGLISAGIFSFYAIVERVHLRLAFIQSSANKTVPVAILTELVSGDVYQWGALSGGLPARLAAGCDLLFAVRRLLRLVADRGGEGVSGATDRKLHRNVEAHRALLHFRRKAGKWLGARTIAMSLHRGPHAPTIRKPAAEHLTAAAKTEA